MVGSRLNVHLYRDSFNTPWGFRLQGGKDLNQPLIVQRVFSNSPAEGELQRGDVILSINNRDGGQLTHKQAQDCIKHGGGQVELVVNRPPPGTQVAPLSPPIQNPRAPTLKTISSPHTPTRPAHIPMYDSHYSPQQMSGGPDQRHQHPRPPAAPHHQPLTIVAPPPDRQRYGSQPPTPTTPTVPPPWSSQQAAPKRVSRLSQLGRGPGFSFAVDYATLPRRRSSSLAQNTTARRPRTADEPEERMEPPDNLATGPVPKVCSLRNLGGGGYDMGSTYGGAATLPRRGARRQLSQPPTMPSGGSTGFMPTRVPISKLGGGGPMFGSDYGRPQTAAQRVQTSLDNITLSPRTPEAPQQPFFQGYEPQYQPQQQQAPQYQAPQYQAPQYQAPQQAPQYQAPHYYAPPPGEQNMFTPTGILLEQQRLQEHQQQEDVPKVPAHQPIPKVLKPKPGPSGYGANFGVDYSKPNFKVAPVPVQAQPTYFKPAPAPTPVHYAPAPAPAPVHYAPAPAPAPAPVHHIPMQTSTSSWQKPPQVVDDGVPAWSNTLKATGVKPWEKDMYSQEQPPARSVPYHPSPSQNHVALAPARAAPAPVSPAEDPKDGPKVVHLQYNSPMGLYSKENVEETLKGQTQALRDDTKAPTNDKGERDWSQSSVLRMVEQENKRGPGPKKAPAPAPKPQVIHIVQQHQPCYDEIGSSDF